jgi:hypothetical protein
MDLKKMHLLSLLEIDNFKRSFFTLIQLNKVDNIGKII